MKEFLDDLSLVIENFFDKEDGYKGLQLACSIFFSMGVVVSYMVFSPICLQIRLVTGIMFSVAFFPTFFVLSADAWTTLSYIIVGAPLLIVSCLPFVLFYCIVWLIYMAVSHNERMEKRDKQKSEELKHRLAVIKECKL